VAQGTGETPERSRRRADRLARKAERQRQAPLDERWRRRSPPQGGE
jgi:hypothetical protein